MGKQIVTSVKFTCDICGNDCNECDSNIEIKVNNGDGRDVGPAFIYAKLRLEQPYNFSDGIVCNSCKKLFLQKYVDSL